MTSRLSKSLDFGRVVPTALLAAVVLLAAWMGDASGGYFVGGWAPVGLALAALLLVRGATGTLRGAGSLPSALALLAFALYTLWTFATILWAPNQGTAWVGAGQTLLYLLAFWVALDLISQGAYRRLVLLASVIGPAALLVLTLIVLPERAGEMIPFSRLLGTIGYANGQAAFGLVTFWVAIYLGGSRRVNPFLRGAALACAALAPCVAVLTQSRGAAAALLMSVPVFFLFSGQRLRGLISLAPVAVALYLAFPEINAVYAAGDGVPPVDVIEQASSTIWLALIGCGLYGLIWGLVDVRWRPPLGLVRFTGGTALAAAVILLTLGTFTAIDRVGNPLQFAGEQVQSFKASEGGVADQSRYLSASGSGRYTLWTAGLEAFREHPVAGVGTHNYEAVYYQQRDEFSLYARQPHMLPLEVLVEKGIVGSILFAGFLGLCAVTALWSRFRRLNTEGKAQVGALAAALSYWFIHAGAEWFWQVPAITLPAIVYLAILVSPWRGAALDRFRLPLRLAALIVGTLAVAAVLPLYLSERQLQESFEAGSPEEALVHIERAQDFNPVNSRLYNREAELALEIGDWQRVENAYEAAIRNNPEHYESYMFKATFHERRGETEQALEFYRKALERNPKSPELQDKVSWLEESTSNSG